MTSEKRLSEVNGIELFVDRHKESGAHFKGPEWVKGGFHTPDLGQLWNRWGQGHRAGGRGGLRAGTHLAQGQGHRARSPRACSPLQPGGQRGQAMPRASGRASGKLRSHVPGGRQRPSFVTLDHFPGPASPRRF